VVDFGGAAGVAGGVRRQGKARSRSAFRPSLLQFAVALVLVAGLLLPAATGWASMLASAVLLSTDANELDCFVSNVGTTQVVINQVSIQNGGNTILSLTTNTCVTTLTAGANCLFSADLDSRFSARGTVKFSGSTKGLRGQCQLTSSANHIIATTDLR
jgi:hypothetical protein